MIKVSSRSCNKHNIDILMKTDYYNIIVCLQKWHHIYWYGFDKYPQTIIISTRYKVTAAVSDNIGTWHAT